MFVLSLLCVLSLSGLAQSPERPKLRVKLGFLYNVEQSPTTKEIPRLFRDSLAKLPNVAVEADQPDVLLVVYIDRNKSLPVMREKVAQIKLDAQNAGQKVNPIAEQALNQFFLGMERQLSQEMRVVLTVIPRNGETPVPHYVNVGPFEEPALTELVDQVVSFCDANIFSTVH